MEEILMKLQIANSKAIQEVVFILKINKQLNMETFLT